MPPALERTIVLEAEIQREKLVSDAVLESVSVLSCADSIGCRTAIALLLTKSQPHIGQS